MEVILNSDPVPALILPFCDDKKSDIGFLVLAAVFSSVFWNDDIKFCKDLVFFGISNESLAYQLRLPIKFIGDMNNQTDDTIKDY